MSYFSIQEKNDSIAQFFTVCSLNLTRFTRDMLHPLFNRAVNLREDCVSGSNVLLKTLNYNWWWRMLVTAFTCKVSTLRFLVEAHRNWCALVAAGNSSYLLLLLKTVID